MKDQTLTTTIDFNAPATEVWKGLTDPAIVKQYFFGTDLVTDWKEGSPIYWRGEWEGKMYEDKGVITSIEPLKHVTYTYWSSMSGTEDKPENYHNVSYNLEEANGITTLTITQDGVKDQAQKEHSEENWQGVMGGLKKLLEQHRSASPENKQA
ncbi:SRPBCC domain-containing protein [Mucilaginibacter hurinus]|uniref:SRPBCC domain-containing protein n=1 Tax=Mucilaginibacter hurinus TaxID=2201324 RepID=A0A367GSX8_9SPHI|nr:SRPBCC domain-containing protein [Mucilaginibacter hurinus]RCH56185.1 SRPBCC domain-containing protein [Mucilaginibacter hurinus]